MTDPDALPPDDALPPLLPEDLEALQLRMFEDHPEMQPAFGSPEIEATAGSAEPDRSLYPMEPLWEEGGDLPGALEALFLASGEVLDLARLQELTGIHEGPLRQAIEKLQERLVPPRGVRLIEVGGGWRMATAREYSALVSRLVTTIRSGKLTPAQVETLAIVAYRQPITIPELNELRGVTSSAQQVRSLLERELVQPVGRKAVVGRPMMYATTQTFLLHFGLKGLHDLPRLADFGESGLEAKALATLDAPEMPEDGLFGEPAAVSEDPSPTAPSP
ncbi:MAG: SMC-Scp complex subunit ScpB [Acidobacteria bacterium]|nr:SMC-Scp complex subunit ScpB [Acidobacteriota bacterium]